MTEGCILFAVVASCRAFLELSSDAQLLQGCRDSNPDLQARAAAQTFYLGQAGDSSEAEVGVVDQAGVVLVLSCKHNTESGGAADACQHQRVSAVRERSGRFAPCKLGQSCSARTRAALYFTPGGPGADCTLPCPVSHQPGVESAMCLLLV